MTEANVMLIPLVEPFGCFGNLYQQLKDLPEGAQVQLKPVD